MEVAQIVSLFRQRVDDLKTPYLYAEPDILAWLSEAQREAAVRARLLFDDSSDLVTIQILPGVRRYKLDPLIFEVEAVSRDRSPQYPGQTPIRYVLADTTAIPVRGDYQNDFYRGSPQVQGDFIDFGFLPDVSYTGLPPGAYSFMRLEAYRLPLADIEALDDDLEIAQVHHDGLIDWLLYRAYMTKDSEAGDNPRSADGYALFESRFGPRPTANSLRMRSEKRRWISGGRAPSWSF